MLYSDINLIKALPMPSEQSVKIGVEKVVDGLDVLRE